MDGLSYPVDLTEAEEGGFIATLPDWDQATQGEDRAEGLAMAEDLLLTLLSAYVATEGMDIPQASEAVGRPVVTPPPGLAAKVELYRIWRASGISKAELGRRVGIGPQQLARLFDLRHASRIEEIEKALRALGKALVISVRNAA